MGKINIESSKDGRVILEEETLSDKSLVYNVLMLEESTESLLTFSASDEKEAKKVFDAALLLNSVNWE